MYLGIVCLYDSQFRSSILSERIRKKLGPNCPEDERSGSTFLYIRHILHQKMKQFETFWNIDDYISTVTMLTGILDDVVLVIV